MKNIYKLMFLGAFLFSGSAMMAQTLVSQDCKKTCTVEKTIGEGSFLGVQITSCGCVEGNEVKVVKVVEGTNAESMGILKGDKIYAINNVPMTDVKFMVEWIGAKYKDFPVTVQLNRDGKDLTLKGKLGFREQKTVTETICCDETVGQLELSNFKVYPNPSKGEFNIDFALNNDQPFQITIADLAGNIVFENEFDGTGSRISQPINLDNQRVSAGEYLIMINQGGKVYRDKVVIVK